MNTIEQFFAGQSLRNDLTENINKILSRHGITGSISPCDLVITEKTLTDSSEEKLSNLIVSAIWPSIPSAVVYHYTSKEAAEQILNTAVFRLTNIEKRFTEDEIVTFCRAHNLEGFLAPDSDNNPQYRAALMPYIFYASFTDATISPEEEKTLWGRFASYDGVRLKLSIQASNPNLRKMYYEPVEGRPIPLLDELHNYIKARSGLPFILRGVSRLCAFYLPLPGYSKEQEIRAMHKVYGHESIQLRGNGSDSYIEIPLGRENETGYTLNILEVHAREKPNMPDRYNFSPRTT